MVRNEITNAPLKGKLFMYETKSGEQRTILLDSKIIYLQPEKGRKIFIIIEDVTANNEMSRQIENGNAIAS